MARVQNKTSRFGDFLDHCADRAGDTLLAACWLIGNNVRQPLAMAGIIMTMLNGYIGTQIEATYGERSYESIGRGEFVLGIIVLPIISYILFTNGWQSLAFRVADGRRMAGRPDAGLRRLRRRSALPCRRPAGALVIERTPITGEPVILAPEREKRPNVYDGAPCPFCPGAEGETPPEIAAMTAIRGGSAFFRTDIRRRTSRRSSSRAQSTTTPSRRSRPITPGAPSS